GRGAGVAAQGPHRAAVAGVPDPGWCAGRGDGQGVAGQRVEPDRGDRSGDPLAGADPGAVAGVPDLQGAVTADRQVTLVVDVEGQGGDAGDPGPQLAHGPAAVGLHDPDRCAVTGGGDDPPPARVEGEGQPAPGRPVRGAER